VLVAVEGGAGDKVLGYASYGPFRAFDGYRQTVEHSVYVAEGARRRGVAFALLLALEERARAGGMHVMIGGVAADNASSLALHRKLGFVETGRMPEVGQKFGRWLDLVFMQKLLTGT
jgi:phosphinothricin acetyltransferase